MIRMVLIGLLAAIGLGEVDRQDPPEVPDLNEQIAAERTKLPGMVFDLFYAVKNSLDYGVSEEARMPEADLRDYRRVTPELMDRFDRDWEVESYRAVADDYELIVTSRTSKEARYRATRNRRYKWEDGEWRDLGGYLYF